MDRWPWPCCNLEVLIVDEERLMILKMLSEGKITPEEAAQLLQALDDGGELAATEAGAEAAAETAAEPAAEAVTGAAAEGGRDGGPTGEPPRVGQPSAPPEPPAPPAPPAPQAAKASGQGIWAGLSGLSGLSELVEGLLGGLAPEAAAGTEVLEELSGDLAGDEVELDLETTNGRITVRGWDQPGYRAVIARRVRAGNTEEAWRRGQELTSLQVSRGRLSFHATAHRDLTLCSLELWVPAGRRYRVEARTGNGRVEVEGLAGGVARLRSGNGRVSVSNGNWEKLELKTGNGSAAVRARGRQMALTTGNGSATVELTGPGPAKVNVATGNGSVTLDTRQAAGTPLHLDVSTGVGGIRHELSGLNVVQQRQHLTGHRLEAHTGDGGSPSDGIQLQVRTGVGTVTIH